MIKYQSIEQFSNLYKEIRHILRHEPTLPVINFIGTTKSHGTSGGIHVIDNEVIAQSRNRVLNLQHDNMGFCAYVMKNQELFKSLAKSISNKELIIYGEFCGSNIQKNVAISQLPKMFLIFSIKIKQDDSWIEFTPTEIHTLFQSINLELVTDLNAIGCYPITQFGTWHVTVDFNDPKPAQEQINSWVTEIDKQCPIGTYFNVTGPGEGIVFTAKYSDSILMFKCKGSSHSVNKSKSSNPTKITTEQIENLQEFVDDVVTEERLNQGIQYLQEMEIPIVMQNLGPFLSWITNDVFKEESINIIENDLDPKQLKKLIATTARNYYITQVNTL